jgi:hypothetical protein
MKNTIPIIAGTRHELSLFLAANPWIDPSKVTNVVQPEDLLGHHGLVLALPDWQNSPSIHTPRKILEAITIRGMQLVVLEQGEYKLKIEFAAYINTVQRRQA